MYFFLFLGPTFSAVKTLKKHYEPLKVFDIKYLILKNILRGLYSVFIFINLVKINHQYEVISCLPTKSHIVEKLLIHLCSRHPSPPFNYPQNSPGGK